tara:strand:+ start:412 stop:570 length:159 start_codon:yes stop_codon:yes gene_type:complete
MIKEEDKEKLLKYIEILKSQEKKNGMIGNNIHLNKNKHNKKNKYKKLWLSQD